MRRDDPGPPVVSAAQPVREPERAWYARGPGIDLRILSLLVIPIAAAILTAAEFQQFATDSEEAARVADRAARERMLTMRMAWAAERVGRGEDSARRELAADRVEFVHVLGELGAIQPQAEQHSGAALVGLRLAIEQVVHAYVQLRPAFDRMLAPETTRAAQLAALEDIRRATPLQLRDVEGILSGLATVESEHRQVELERLALLVGVQTSCVLIIVLWFAFRVRRARRREAELRPFAQIARHTSSGLAIADADRRVLWTNEACKLLTMVEPAELCGKTLDDWFASALVPAGLPDKAVFTRGFRCEVELSRPTGPPAWVDLEVVPARDQDGRIEQYVVTLQDITARVETMNALHESDARFRSALDAMQEGLVVQHADGTIEICNPAAERILGMSSDQLCGRTSLDPRWRSVHEDGSPFPGDAHPAMVSLRMMLAPSFASTTWIPGSTSIAVVNGAIPTTREPSSTICAPGGASISRWLVALNAGLQSA